MSDDSDVTLYSIGHGARKIEDFMALLKRYDIQYVADVRSKPRARFHPHFNREALKASLEAAGIRYTLMGEQLGGIPKQEGVRDEEGRIDYEKLKQEGFFKAGIERLVTANEKKIRLACMCSESQPCDCHRSKLIGDVLLDKYKLSMKHITKEGEIESQEEVMRKVTEQPDMFSGNSLKSKASYAVSGKKLKPAAK